MSGPERDSPAAVRLERVEPAATAGVRALLERNGLPTADLDSSGAVLFEALVDGRSVGVGGFWLYGADALLRSVANWRPASVGVVGRRPTCSRPTRRRSSNGSATGGSTGSRCRRGSAGPASLPRSIRRRLPVCRGTSRGGPDRRVGAGRPGFRHGAHRGPAAGSTGRRSGRTKELCRRARRVGGMARTQCPECGGRVTRQDGTVYECQDCETRVDAMDLFVP